ncbi:MAG: M28 family peptidase [Armatimonadetes bacterium]|nr:M28 family peptidase [Armatimonadota bacterium]
MKRRSVRPRRTLLTGILIGVAALAGVGGAVVLRGATPAPAEFDGNRAFDLLKRQCDFGPRPVGTLAHEKTRAYLIQAMQQVSDKTEVQDFDWSNKGKTYRLTNVIGVLNPEAKQKVMIAAHWDTRPTAEMDPVAANRSKPILGANDGASGVAVVLELARVLKAKRPDVGVIYMLFDGEDVGPSLDNMFLGAKYFAKNMGAYRPDKMILVDMVGDANLSVYKEMNSLNSDRALVDRVWSTAARLGYGSQFPNEVGYTILDDHIPMQQAGVPSIDLIDFHYPDKSNRYWHTQEDTVDKCSPDALKAVGRTVHAVVMEWPR